VVIRDRAVVVLAHYCERTGRRLTPMTGRGKPSEALKRIVMRLLDCPAMTAEEVERVVDNVLASPPSWVDGVPDVGDIFGPRAWERALTNDGRPSGKDEVSAARHQRAADRLESMQRLAGVA
jgi:hypothetical protein